LVVADVTHIPIGVDFLSHFGLLVHRKYHLLDEVTSLSAPAQAASSLLRSKTVSGGTAVDRLLAEFPNLTRLGGGQHEVRHTPSITSRLYQAHRSHADHGD
jgi:hypothetical protein